MEFHETEERERKMIVSFAGHANIPFKEQVKMLVKEQLRSHIIGSNQITCYLGGYGDFDDICAHACKELKQEIGGIELVYVTPYLHLSEQYKIKEKQRSGLYDASIYPLTGHIPPKFAISKRNEWMMTHSNLIIAYVNRSYGGAYHSLQVAKRRKKEIVNICDFLL